MIRRLESIMVRVSIIVVGLGLLGAPVFAQANGPAGTPPMGWNSWNHFACKVTEADVRSAADALVSTGMKARATFT